jgi:DNA-binding MarR family transcriptional regulator
MQDLPGYSLHRLVRELDRHADRLLQDRLGISYKRALFLAQLKALGSSSQRELAQALGYTDAAVSLMARDLARAGFVEIGATPRAGRTHRLDLTAAGNALIVRGVDLVAKAFAEVVGRAGVDFTAYERMTDAMIAALSPPHGVAP